MSPRFSIITERPKDGASQEQLDRFYQRYAFALPYAKGKTVLELACGAGIGLGLLAGEAAKVIGGDIDPENVVTAQSVASRYPNVTVQTMDAQSIPLADNSVDVVLLYEAIYYIPDVNRMLAEVRRVLSPGGVIIVVSANRLWLDFNPSKYSVRYYSKSELMDILAASGFKPTLYKSYDVDAAHASSVPSRLKRTAVRWGLIPKSMFFKQFLKRIFMGKLVRLPNDIREINSTYSPPKPVAPNDPNDQFKVIFAVGVSA